MREEHRRPRRVTRRGFLSTGAAALGATGFLGAQDAPVGAGQNVRMGFIGVGGRGTTHLRTILDVPGFEVSWVCDIDPTALDRASSLVGDRTGKKPRAT